MNGFDLSTVSGIYIGNQLASAAYYGNNLIWQSHDYSLDPLTFEAIDDCVFSISDDIGENYYLLFDNSYNLIDGLNKDNKTSQTILAGNVIHIIGMSDYANNIVNKIGNFSSTGRFNVYGNIMSIVISSGLGSYDNSAFINETDLSDWYSNLFDSMFKNCTNLIDVSNLILPATTLISSCYSQMFNGCTSLIATPKLPATTLAQMCYQSMFYGCTSLTTAPLLPATTLAQSCYNGMFQGCTSLTTAPELPATTLAITCYNSMFMGCTSLTKAPDLLAETLLHFSPVI